MGKAKGDFWEAYRDPRWQRKRLEVMDAAGWKCEECGDNETTLNVHHLFYIKDRKPWEYENRALRCLCENCHEETHDLTTELKVLLGELSTYALAEVLGYVKGHIGFAGDDREFSVRHDGESYGFCEAQSYLGDLVRPIAERMAGMTSLRFDDFAQLIDEVYWERHGSDPNLAGVEFHEEMTFADHDALPDISFLDV